MAGSRRRVWTSLKKAVVDLSEALIDLSKALIDRTIRLVAIGPMMKRKRKLLSSLIIPMMTKMMVTRI